MSTSTPYGDHILVEQHRTLTPHRPKHSLDLMLSSTCKLSDCSSLASSLLFHRILQDVRGDKPLLLSPGHLILSSYRVRYTRNAPLAMQPPPWPYLHSISAVSLSALNPQGQEIRQSARQTRTNPSRTCKTIRCSSLAFGRGSTTELPTTPPVPRGLYPALTHFTDAITALPREFCRHNSLLMEVDAKAWALEENLLRLLKHSSESQPVPRPSQLAPIARGREDVLPKVGRFHRKRVLWRILLLMAPPLTSRNSLSLPIHPRAKPSTPFRSRATEPVRPYDDGRREEPCDFSRESGTRPSDGPTEYCFPIYRW